LDLGNEKGMPGSEAVSMPVMKGIRSMLDTESDQSMNLGPCKTHMHTCPDFTAVMTITTP